MFCGGLKAIFDLKEGYLPSAWEGGGTGLSFSSSCRFNKRERGGKREGERWRERGEGDKNEFRK
jgi:hypothetical protein